LEDQNGRCYISGEPLSFVSETWDTISFDRLNSNLGYSVENTVLVTRFVNISKNNVSLEEYLKRIEKIYLGSQNLRNKNII